MAREKIAIIEDEPDILEVIAHNLKREGYRVAECRDGGEAVQLIRVESPSLVLLDLMLPGMDGLEICRTLKQDSLTRSIPVIMVTAKGEESDIVAGLALGADDYIRKPFSPKELVARVKAVLRRGPFKEIGGEGARIVRGKLAIEPDKFGVSVGTKSVTLTPTEFRILGLLAAHPGRVFTRDQIMSRAIGDDATVVDRNIDVHVRALRKKLGENPDYIETIRGIGYRFTEET